MEDGKIESFKDLKMWQKSKDFAVEIYKATEKFPGSEKFGLSDQLRRAAVSIPSNIAEGFRRRFPKEKIQFLRISYGSGAEIETQLIIAGDLGYISGLDLSDLQNKLCEVMKMINVVINKL